jgi:hypothetical protein
MIPPAKPGGCKRTIDVREILNGIFYVLWICGKEDHGSQAPFIVDTLGLLLSVAVHPANIQDHDGVALVLNRRTRRLFPFIGRIYGDGDYQGPKAEGCRPSCTIEIVEPLSTAVGFEVLPKAGSSNAPLPGSAGSAAWHVTSSATPEPLPVLHLDMIRIVLKRLVASSSS